VLHTAKPHAATDRALALLALRPLSVALDPSDAGMARIVPDSISLTTHHLHMCFTETDTVLSSGTGFVYEHHGIPYLITNWHNVSGRNPSTNACLSDTLAVPDSLVGDTVGSLTAPVADDRLQAR